MQRSGKDKVPKYTHISWFCLGARPNPGPGGDRKKLSLFDLNPHTKGRQVRKRLREREAEAVLCSRTLHAGFAARSGAACLGIKLNKGSLQIGGALAGVPAAEAQDGVAANGTDTEPKQGYAVEKAGQHQEQGQQDQQLQQEGDEAQREQEPVHVGVKRKRPEKHSESEDNSGDGDEQNEAEQGGAGAEDDDEVLVISSGSGSDSGSSGGSDSGSSSEGEDEDGDHDVEIVEEDEDMDATAAADGQESEVRHC